MKRALRLDDKDNVAVALEKLQKGDEVMVNENIIIAAENIDTPHKIAIKEIAEGENVLKYGEVIGYATRPIHAGEHVHVHNVDAEKMMK